MQNAFDSVSVTAPRASQRQELDDDQTGLDFELRANRVWFRASE